MRRGGASGTGDVEKRETVMADVGKVRAVSAGSKGKGK